MKHSETKRDKKKSFQKRFCNNKNIGLSLKKQGHEILNIRVKPVIKDPEKERGDHGS